MVSFAKVCRFKEIFFWGCLGAHQIAEALDWRRAACTHDVTSLRPYHVAIELVYSSCAQTGSILGQQLKIDWGQAGTLLSPMGAERLHDTRAGDGQFRCHPPTIFMASPRRLLAPLSAVAWFDGHDSGKVSTC